jgi:hypothetical protein
MAEAVKPQSQPIAPLPTVPPLAVEAFPKSKTVTMVFPKPVTLTLSDQTQVRFKEGPQEVPVELKDHWYLKANKVVAYAPTRRPPRPPATPVPAATTTVEIPPQPVVAEVPKVRKKSA